MESFKKSTFVLIMIFSINVHSESFEYRPYLHLHGKILADHLTSDICEDPRTYDYSNYNRYTPLVAGWLGLLGSPFTRKTRSKLKKDIAFLEDWVLSNPDRSVDPLMLAKKAIQLKNGSVLNGLQLAYNLLSAGTQTDDKTGFIKRPIFSKLVDITGEQKMAQDAFRNNPSPVKSAGYFTPISSRGSLASSWYHFFGAAMIAYDEGTKSPPIPLPCDLASANARVMGTTVVKSMLAIEKIFDVATKSFTDSIKRDLTNKEGMEFGANLAANIVLLKSTRNCTNFRKPEGPYLFDRPDIYGPNYPLRPDKNPTDHK